MKTELILSVTPTGYYHIVCKVTGFSEETDNIKKATEMLWKRLSTGYKGYVRREPEFVSYRNFEEGREEVAGRFRLTTSDEAGELTNQARTDDQDMVISGFGLGLKDAPPR